MENSNTEIAVQLPDIKPEVTLVGNDGNAYAIIGSCKRASRDNYSAKEWESIQKEMMSGDYDHLLYTAMEFFDVD